MTRRPRVLPVVAALACSAALLSSNTAVAEDPTRPLCAQPASDEFTGNGLSDVAYSLNEKSQLELQVTLVVRGPACAGGTYKFTVEHDDAEPHPHSRNNAFLHDLGWVYDDSTTDGHDAPGSSSSASWITYQPATPTFYDGLGSAFTRIVVRGTTSTRYVERHTVTSGEGQPKACLRWKLEITAAGAATSTYPSGNSPMLVCVGVGGGGAAGWN